MFNTGQNEKHEESVPALALSLPSTVAGEFPETKKWKQLNASQNATFGFSWHSRSAGWLNPDAEAWRCRWRRRNTNDAREVRQGWAKDIFVIIIECKSETEDKGLIVQYLLNSATRLQGEDLHFSATVVSFFSFKYPPTLSWFIIDASQGLNLSRFCKTPPELFSVQTYSLWQQQQQPTYSQHSI